MTNNKRLNSLDWLRGIMAFSIMIYHLFGWKLGRVYADNPLGKLGIYAVSVFFILSGLSMAMVYKNYIKDVETSIFFYLKRIFRIWPLLFIATTVAAILDKNFKFIFSKEYIYNITGIFGFINPSGYYATGAWSIGNELVYYFITPFVIWAYNYSKKIGNIIFYFSVFIGVYYSNYILKIHLPLGDQWSLYVNPLNNLFLYLSGIWMFYNFQNMVIEDKINYIMLGILIIIFCYIPGKLDHISIVTGTSRIFFSIISIMIVFCFYKINIKKEFLLLRFFEKIGISTYGIYMLHPLVVRLFNFNNSNQVTKILEIVLTALTTIFLAYISYYYFELRITKLGKKIIEYISNKFEKRV